MDIRAVLMGLAFAAMWSSAFTSARIIVASAPPLTTLALRFLISGLIAIAIARLMKQTWNLTRTQWRATIIFGICQNGLYLGLNFVAMQWVEASLAAIIASTMPLLVALAGWLILRDAPKPLAMVGLIAGIAGVALVMGTRMGQGVDLTGVLLCLVGVVALTVATMALRGALSGGNYMMIVGLQMLIGSAFLWPFGLALETIDVVWSSQLIAAFAYTTLVPGLAATFIWVLLVNRIGAVRAATFHFLNPFLGVAFAAILLGEQLRVSDFVGVLVIAAGILAVQLSHVGQIRKMRDKT